MENFKLWAMVCAMALLGCSSGSQLESTPVSESSDPVGIASVEGAPSDVASTHEAPLAAAACETLQLEARKTYNPVAYYDAERTFTTAKRWVLPSEVPVISGNAGNQLLTFTYRLSFGFPVVCIYRGGSSQAHPSNPAQVALGLKYKHLLCTNGLAPGAVFQTRSVKLHIDNGDSNHPDTQVRMSLVEPPPCADPCSGVPVDDNNPCTADACDSTTGQVTHTPLPEGTACPNTTVCDGAETCNGSSQCVDGTPPVVDDNNPCTIDSCDSVQGVRHDPAPAGTSCSDGNLCNGAEACNPTGECTAGTPPPIDDGNACTVDSCDPNQGVTHTPAPEGTSCSDSDACNGNETCNTTAACQPGTPPPVDDGNPCTIDSCDHTSGVSHVLVSTGTDCSDGNVCNGSEACNSLGSCQLLTPPPLDDGNPCTADSCDPNTGFSHTPVPAGSSCSDGDACNGTETCNASASCSAGVPPELDDDNACTTDSCSPTLGVTHDPAVPGTSCADNSVCNGAEVCDASAQCQPGTPLPTDDNNPCTVDSCDHMTGVAHLAAPSGTACPDGNACNGSELCNGSGQCQPGTPVVVDDGNACTGDSCDPETGAVAHTPAPAGTSCPSSDLCHELGSCTATGQCQSGPPLVLDDGDPCTIEICDPVTGPQVTRCSEIDRTVATTVADSNAWIHSGTNPLQRGVAPGTIERPRAALLQGKVLNRQGQPLSGVTLSIADHPELGTTESHSNGNFLMVVNGGGTLVVRFEKAGLLRVDRTIQTAWNGNTQVPEVVLIEPDPIVTRVDLADTSQEFQVHQASVSNDSSGPRQGTLLFPAGVEAQMLRSDGTLVPISELHVRATEFTVGDSGPAAMPGDLPATSAYTYAFELNADEAVAAGASTVQFSQPLVYYVDNFLHFPPGTTVPLGAYDRAKGIWIPEESGVVFTIIGEAGGEAQLNVDSDPEAETPAELAALSINAAELRQLASLYEPGRSLWRVRIPHFTSPWDSNWGVIPPDDAEEGGEVGDPPSDGDPCETRGSSTIECQNQILREEIPVTGAPLTLHYSTGRVPGYAVPYRVPITLSGPSLPPSLNRIELTVQVAGKTHKQVFPPIPNWGTEFSWDGRDSFGRRVQGNQQAQIDVQYIYRAQYGSTTRFGHTGGPTLQITGNSARTELAFGKSFWRPLGAWKAKDAGLGGWTLSEHHTYDPVGHKLMLGDGTQFGSTLKRVMEATPEVQRSGDWGNGGPLKNAVIDATRIAVEPNGAYYILSQLLSVIRRVTPDGIIDHYAGGLPYGTHGFGGDGGPAAQAVFHMPHDIALARDGSLFIADTSNHRVRRIDRNGIISTVAGTGVRGFSGDNGPAHLAQLDTPWGLGAAQDGSMYIADLGNFRIRRIAPDGRITTEAGSGPNDKAQAPGENVPATSPLDVMFPHDVAVGPNGDLLVADGLRGVVRRVNKNGLVSTIAGVDCSRLPSCPVSVVQEGVPATQSGLGTIWSIDVAADGSYYLASRNLGRILMVDNAGMIRTFAGGGTLNTPNGATPTSLNLPLVEGVTVGPDGIYTGVSWYVAIMRLPFPGLSASDQFIPSKDGRQVFVFDMFGKHRSTRDALTGTLVNQFEYDPQGLLATVRDSHSNETRIERAADGTPVAIVSPYGQRTLLSVDSNGYLASVINPANETVGMTYTTDGLLSSFTNGRGDTSTYQYDARGRLTRVDDPAGGIKSLSRDDLADGWRVNLHSVDGATTRYDVHQPKNGTETRTTTFANNLVSQQSRPTNGNISTTLADGTLVAETRAPDPRFGLIAPVISTTVRTPSGLTLAHQTQRSVTIFGGALQQIQDIIQINGRTAISRYDGPSRTWTFTSPGGRTTSLRLNADGTAAETRRGSLLGELLSYDARGRLASTLQGARTTSFSFFNTADATNGFLSGTTNPLNQTTSFSRDAVGRLLAQIEPDSSVVDFGWDTAGNLTSVTPPSRPAHTMSYSPVNMLTGYAPPVLSSVPNSSTSYLYNRARQITRATRPDGQVTNYTYDTAARLVSLVTPTGTVAYEYHDNTVCAGCAPGRLKKISGPTGVDITYGYDGMLTTAEAWSGLVNGALTREYDNDFRVKKETLVAGSAQSVAFGYDNDGLVTCASPTSCSPPGADAELLIYHAQHGLPTSIRLGNVTESFTYNAHGELATQSATLSGSVFFAEQYDSASVPRDALRRIVRKVETLQGTAHAYDYTYDVRGRLKTVSEDGSLKATYVYDANSNRERVTRPNGTVVGTYDAQDRLTAYGDYSYSYTANGDLSIKTNTQNGEATAYQYDVLGNLRRVDLPNGTTVEYLVDGRGRRVGKKVNGTLVRQWLYRDSLRPMAELDGVGNLVSRYVYASRPNVPDYVIRGGVVYRVLADQLGSPKLIVNASTGAVAQRLRHDEFGNVVEDTATGFTPFGFAGGMYDADTGLVRFGARDYDPYVGRWVSKDPMRFDGDGSNLYVYVGSDPVNKVDPTGLQTIPWWPLPIPLGPAVGAAVGGMVFGIPGALIGVCIGAALSTSGDTPTYPKPNLDRCLDACEQGTAGREAFCRGIRDPSEKARCWKQVAESERSCINWCHNEYG